ncbi:MAG TPA: IS1595 family transposase [Micropepsaceae bacterium]|jgi:transposase-like protein|nr:IS1595 family transposase [Micropepsaceae bacterium]
MSINLKAKIYNDEDAARAHLEKLQWPEGPVCPHCGVIDNAAKLEGKSTRPGVYKCRDCEKPFSVTVGTVFERSHIPLTKWLLATQLLTSSKKGISAHQLHRMLGVTYKTAWFMAHRIREAMTPKNPPQLGGEGKTVEMDETYIGRRVGPHGAGIASKIAVVSLVERGGKLISFHLGKATKINVQAALHANVHPKSVLMTDESNFYKRDTGMKHHTVTHSLGEYVRYTKGETIHTNTIEGVFSIFKRGMVGVYQHCGEQHLQRYLNEFDFRYSHRAALGVDDAERAEKALTGIGGKRLTYRRIVQA